jgi:hypothetical protein
MTYSQEATIFDLATMLQTETVDESDLDAVSGELAKCPRRHKFFQNCSQVAIVQTFAAESEKIAFRGAPLDGRGSIGAFESISALPQVAGDFRPGAFPDKSRMELPRCPQSFMALQVANRPPRKRLRFSGPTPHWRPR